MSTQGHWVGQWVGDWQGATEGGGPYVVLAALVAVGSGSAVLTASVSRANAGAGKGGSLADYEAEWALKRAQDAIEKAQGESSKVRRRVRRQAAREVYFAPPLPDVAQVYVERLKAERYEAELAEMRALLDLSSQASAVKAEVARAAVQMARKKQAAAAQALEEFDVMYVAAILAEA